MQHLGKVKLAINTVKYRVLGGCLPLLDFKFWKGK